VRSEANRATVGKTYTKKGAHRGSLLTARPLVASVALRLGTSRVFTTYLPQKSDSQGHAGQRLPTWKASCPSR